MTMEERAAAAAELKAAGKCNCTQSVLRVFTDKLPMDEDTLMKLGAGYAAGMGCMESTCGALIGAVMVAGICTDGKGAALPLPGVRPQCGAGTGRGARPGGRIMRGLGTAINALAILAGGALGILCRSFLQERYQDTIIKATGFSVVFLGAAGTLSKMLNVSPDGSLTTGGSMVMILSLALGALLGELINLDFVTRIREYPRKKNGKKKSVVLD